MHLAVERAERGVHGVHEGMHLLVFIEVYARLERAVSEHEPEEVQTAHDNGLGALGYGRVVGEKLLQPDSAGRLFYPVVALTEHVYLLAEWRFPVAVLAEIRRREHIGIQCEHGCAELELVHGRFDLLGVGFPARLVGNRRGGGNNKALELEIEKQKELVEEANDRYKRLLAEFENARNRNEKESKHMYDVGAKDVLEKLLPVVDNFERALQAIPDEDKERAFEQGVDKIYKQMMDILGGIGVSPMNAEGQHFDPDYHNAVLHVEDESLGENVVAEELQKGYMYKEEVLRHSMVKVAN